MSSSSPNNGHDDDDDDLSITATHTAKTETQRVETTKNRLMISSWIGYHYLTKFRFLSAHADNDETTSSFLRKRLFGYGLVESAFKKTRDAYRKTQQLLFVRKRIRDPATNAADEQHIGEPSPKRTKTLQQQHDDDDDDVKTNVFVTPERHPYNKRSKDEENESDKHAAAAAAARARAESRAAIAAEFEFVRFQTSGRKKPLPMGRLATTFGELLDRQDSIEEFYSALEKIAQSMRLRTPRSNDKDEDDSGNEDKNDDDSDETASKDTNETEYLSAEETDGTSSVQNSINTNNYYWPRIAPLIGVTGRPGTGKTEFLRWVFNNCCTFQGSKCSAHSKKLLERINRELPEDIEPLQNLLVLYASYSGTSGYSTKEGPICGTTVERLLRSYHGILDFEDNYPAQKRRRYEGFAKGQSIVDAFTKEYGTTGFVFLLDDLSHVQHHNPSEYVELVDSILEFSQLCLDKGTLCAVVGSSTSALDLCETVVGHCKKSMVPISFSPEMPQLEEKATTFWEQKHHRRTTGHPEKNENNNDLALSVTMKVLQSMQSPRLWEKFIFDDNGKMESIVRKPFFLNDSVSPGYLFAAASRTLVGKKIVEPLDAKTVKAFVDDLAGHLVLEKDSSGRIDERGLYWGTLSMPIWRLFQIPIDYNHPLVPQVDNWVWVESRRLFFEYGPNKNLKTLETATLALLELRKAVLQVVHEEPPSLKTMYDGIRVQHNLDKGTLSNTKATNFVTKLRWFGALPYSFEVVHEPTLYLSSSSPSGQQGFEGIFRECFEGMTIFVQTKTYAPSGGRDELCEWLVHAHKRARDLGYSNGEYIVQLFVPGDGNTEREDTGNESIRNWPANSMVFCNNAIMDIFEPFLELNL